MLSETHVALRWVQYIYTRAFIFLPRSLFLRSVFFFVFLGVGGGISVYKPLEVLSLHSGAFNQVPKSRIRGKSSDADGSVVIGCFNY